MPDFKDLTGRRFSRWTVIERAPDHISSGGYKFTAWKCRCDCGNEKVVLSNALISGRSESCGCLHAEHQADIARSNFKTHGSSKTRLYHIWAGMRKRCYDQSASNYSNYGGRGIKVCDEWNSGYGQFRDWALAHGYRDGLSIDRIDVDGDYTPDNCRWADRVLQANNRRTSVCYEYNGVTHTIAELARLYNLNYKSLWKKLHNGASLDSILSI